jgi:hypothetical protein
MRSLFLSLFLTLSFALPTRAQTIEKPYAFNCTTLQLPSEGCTSYNEMIVKKDQELMEFIDNMDHVYVCFRPMQDVFLFFAFKTPGEAKYKMGSSGYLEADGQMVYFRYTDGLLEDSKIGNGKWTKFSIKGGPVFFTRGDGEIKSSVSDSEFSVSYTFPNLTHKTTNYSASVRRSTLRFSEEYTFPQTATTSKKGAKQEPPPETDDRLSYAGYCAQIKPSSYLFYPSSPQ